MDIIKNNGQYTDEIGKVFYSELILFRYDDKELDVLYNEGIKEKTGGYTSNITKEGLYAVIHLFTLVHNMKEKRDIFYKNHLIRIIREPRETVEQYIPGGMIKGSAIGPKENSSMSYIVKLCINYIDTYNNNDTSINFPPNIMSEFQKKINEIYGDNAEKYIVDFNQAIESFNKNNFVMGKDKQKKIQINYVFPRAEQGGGMINTSHKNTRYYRQLYSQHKNNYITLVKHN